MVGFVFHQESYGCILFQVDSYTTEKALKKVKRLPTSVPQKINVTDVIMEDKGDGELEKQTVQMPSDVQQISKGDEDHQSIKRNSPLTGDRIAKHKQTSTFIGGTSNW
jgi:exosome complex component RRP45